MHPRVQPVYASPSLNYEITENLGENLAQDIHQSRRNLRRDKCHSSSRFEQRAQRRVKRSSPPTSPSINTQERSFIRTFTYSLADSSHTLFFALVLLSRIMSDLSIGRVSSNTLPTSSNQLPGAVGVLKTSTTLHQPADPTSRSPEVVAARRLSEFGYINIFKIV
ncbi:ABC transporter B family member 11-like [Dorcoceras hygrometricum]|uniref:ABC transporter B family member 11-like n=1 Tax=Dorcoceras hygrometricum TaxID=472368 RepID=A0A2Z7BMH1_9LAMI|nr:ABC transporter B family member 11-like [Dorcoceras hygrometricum]